MVLAFCENIFCTAYFNNFASVHHGYVVAGLGYDAEIMGYHKEKLAALLEGEAKALLLRLIDADSEISNTLALENFIQGFRLGMRLAMEGLDEAEGVDRA